MEEHLSTRVGPRKLKRRRPPYRASEHSSEDDVREPRRRGKSPLLLVGLGLLLWCAPWLVAHSFVSGMLIARATRGLEGSVHVSGISLGWLSPITLDGIEVRDAKGQPLLKVSQLTSDKRLASWLVNRSDLGSLRVQDPEADLVFDAEGNNFQRTFAAWLKQDPKEPRRSVSEILGDLGLSSLNIEIVNGSADIVDHAHHRRCAVQAVQGSARLLSPQDGLRAAIRGDVEATQKLSPFEATIELVPPASGSVSTSVNQLAVNGAGFPLWLVGAAMQGVAPGLELDGQLVSQLDCQWRENNLGVEQFDVKGHVTTNELRVAGPWFKGDVLRLASAQLPVSMSWRKNELKVEQLDLQCELGELAFGGSLDTSLGLMNSLTAKPYHLTGHVDLARVATMLPNTVRVRNDTRITAGVINVVLNAEAGTQGLGWHGKLESSKLSAVSGGQTLTWEKPVSMNFDAHETNTGVVIDRLYAEADFLELQGEGTPNDGHVSGVFDLDRLSRELSRFVDLGDLRMAGTGTAHATWHRNSRGEFTASTQIDAEKFEMSRPGERPWSESRIDLTAEVAGVMQGGVVESIDRGELRVVAGADLLEARLEQPVVQVSRTGLWPVLVTMRGELARWLPRAEPWIGSYAGYDLSGSCDLTADVVYSTVGIELEPLAAKIQNFHLHGPAIRIDEPNVDLNVTSKWDAQTKDFELQNGRWASPAMVAQATDLLIALDPKRSGEMKGGLQYSADLTRIWQAVGSAKGPNDLKLAGRLAGRVDIQRSGSLTRATLDNQIDHFVASLDGGHSWQETQLRLISHLEHDSTRDLVKLNDFAVSSQALQTTASGQIGELSGERNVQLDGTLRYDLAKLQPVWQQWTGAGVRMVGVDERPFSIRGPLAAIAKGTNEASTDLARLNGSAGIRWARGDLYGFQLGAGDLNTRLANGVLNVDPIDVVASSGRLHLAPTIRVAPGPIELTVPPGRAIDHVQITTEMCERALKFIAPALAGVTSAEGRFSVDLEGCRIPLATPAAGDMAGKMTVHSVAVGPGPLVQECAMLLNCGASAQITRESVVDFRLVQGRFYHRGLELVFPEFTLRTYGSVGVDESLAIMAEMPVPPKWIGENLLGDALRNQTIHLPIGGTLHKPQFDRQALNQLNAQLIKNTTTGLLKQEFRRGVDSLLGPLK